MDSNLYQAPETEIISPDATSGSAALYVISLKKFTLLFLLTLGVYSIYWNYRNWKLLKQHRGVKCMPVLRGIFSIFFFAALLKHVNEELGDADSKDHLPVTPLASAYIIMSIISSIADRMSARTETVGALDFISLILLPFLCGVVATAQQAINVSQGDPGGTSNSQLTVLNGIWMLLGLSLWLLILFGFMVMIAPDSIPF